MVASVGGENPAAKKGGRGHRMCHTREHYSTECAVCQVGERNFFLGAAKNARERHPGRLFLNFCLPPRDHEAVEVHGGREGVQIYVFVLAVNACQLLLVDTEGSKPQAITG